MVERIEYTPESSEHFLGLVATGLYGQEFLDYLWEETLKTLTNLRNTGLYSESTLKHFLNIGLLTPSPRNVMLNRLFDGEITAEEWGKFTRKQLIHSLMR